MPSPGGEIHEDPVGDDGIVLRVSVEQPFEHRGCSLVFGDRLGFSSATLLG